MQTQVTSRTSTIKRGRNVAAQKIVIYGTGGIGKSELAWNVSKIPGKNPLIIDVENSSNFLDAARIDDINSWQDLRSDLQNNAHWSEHNVCILDSITKAEELASLYVPQAYKYKDKFVGAINEFGWGEGYDHQHNEMLKLLGDLDALIRRGIDVIVIAHDTTARVPNPGGIDYIRYEPRIYKPTNPTSAGKSDTRAKVKEWSDHLLFVGYDVNVTENGRGQGAGTRTIYPCEMPTHMAKTRSLTEQQIDYPKDSIEVWTQLFGA